MDPIPRFAALLLLPALAACATARIVGGETVGPGYVTGGGEWSSGGGITAVVAVREKAGRAVVCGAWTTDRQSALSLFHNEDAMAAASVFLAHRRLVQNLSFMARYPETDKLTGVTARCVESTAPWRPEFAGARPELRFPRLVFFEGGGGDFPPGGSGGTVVFRQTPRPDAVK